MQIQNQAFGAGGGNNIKDVTNQGDCRPAVNHTVHSDGRRRIVPGEFDQKRRSWIGHPHRPFERAGSIRAERKPATQISATAGLTTVRQE